MAWFGDNLPVGWNHRHVPFPGDTIIFLGAVALVVFVAGLKTGHSFRNSETTTQETT